MTSPKLFGMGYTVTELFRKLCCTRPKNRETSLIFLQGGGVIWTTQLFWTRPKMDKNDKSNFQTRLWVGVGEREAKLARGHWTGARHAGLTMSAQAAETEQRFGRMYEGCTKIDRSSQIPRSCQRQ